MRCQFLFYILFSIFLVRTVSGAVLASDYESLQAALDAGAGSRVSLDGGSYVLTEPLRVRGEGTRLVGPGTIVQTDPKREAIVVENVDDIVLRDFVVTRSDDTQDADNSAILIMDASRVEVVGVRIENSKARDAAIQLRRSDRCTIRDCVVRNYKRIAVDDRTDSEHYGYAFRCIDGTGILANGCTHLMVVDNRIIEDALIPTEAIKKEVGLGALVEGRSPTKAGKLGQKVVNARYANNWHQGSAIVITGPEQSRFITVRGNQIENAAQGIDLHTDFAVVTDNVVDHCLIGLKATHGCRGLTLANNIVSHVDLWGIILNPGAASHGGKADGPPNVDGGIVISGNIIADYGYGHEYWNWGGSYAIALYDGQLSENPAMRDVVIQGNVVYDPGRDTGEAPRYRYALFVGSWHGAPEDSPNLTTGISIVGNRFHPGRDGVTNYVVSDEVQ